ncbi:hypothetical protein Tsubulata_036997 [Turnera subulata]|uniref:Uncharacterized protein n=1 Tax=Turnera subulata TaxID=218843 RepID=A0A9Q0FG28_9ROSI|nr:hypothetical protein Tsubulata_036997 [Turnera subulata]
MGQDGTSDCEKMREGETAAQTEAAAVGASCSGVGEQGKEAGPTVARRVCVCHPFYFPLSHNLFLLSPMNGRPTVSSPISLPTFCFQFPRPQIDEIAAVFRRGRSSGGRCRSELGCGHRAMAAVEDQQEELVPSPGEEVGESHHGIEEKYEDYGGKNGDGGGGGEEEAYEGYGEYDDEYGGGGGEEGDEGYGDYDGYDDDEYAEGYDDDDDDECVGGGGLRFFPGKGCMGCVGELREGGAWFNRFWDPPPCRYENQPNLREALTYPGTFLAPNQYYLDKFLNCLSKRARQFLTPYFKIIQKTMGFEVPSGLPANRRLPFGIIRPLSEYLDPENRLPKEYLKKAIDMCMDTALEWVQILTGEEHKLQSVDRVNGYSAWCELYFLTFTASNLSTNQTETFQAVIQFQEWVADMDEKGNGRKYYVTPSFIRVKP